MALTILDWRGRLGNQITQLGTCFHLAHKFRLAKIRTPPHAFLRSQELRVEHAAGVELADEGFEGYFYSEHESMGVYRAWDAKALELCTSVRRALTFSPRRVPATTLVIAVRSGDIFAMSAPHKDFLQPPMAFYRRVVELCRDEIDSVLVVTDPARNNPCLRLMRTLPLPVKIVSRDVRTDFETLMGAERIALSMSSFAINAVMLENKPRTVYMPSYFNEGRGPDMMGHPGMRVQECTVVTVDLPGYIRPGTWANTREQRQIMQSYRLR